MGIDQLIKDMLHIVLPSQVSVQDVFVFRGSRLRLLGAHEGGEGEHVLVVLGDLAEAGQVEHEVHHQLVLLAALLHLVHQGRHPGEGGQEVLEQAAAQRVPVLSAQHCCGL